MKFLQLLGSIVLAGMGLVFLSLCVAALILHPREYDGIDGLVTLFSLVMTSFGIALSIQATKDLS